MGVTADRTVAVELLSKVSDYVAGQQAAATATERTAVAMRDAAKAQTQLEASQRRAASATAAASKAAAAHEAASKKQLAALTTLGRGAATFGAVAALGFGAAGKAASDFGKRMALVGTLAKASPSQLKQLTQAAETVGVRFGYTANQVSDAEAELVKAGLNVQQVIGGGLTGALTLAAAAQTDVATATELAVSAMTQFGLQANQISHVADLLSAGADKALGSATDLGLGLEHIGTTAHQFGFSIEETVGVLAEFAQAGQIGERAGTELNTMLLQLAKPTVEGTALMKQYGFSIYDASGNTKTFAQIADNLRSSFSGLTQEQRSAAFATLFGTRAVQAANILYKGGGAAVRQWTTAVNDSGFAAGQASGKLNSLAGDVQKLRADALTGLIETGDQATGTLRELVQGADALVRAFNDLGPGGKTLVVDLTAIGAGVGLIGGGILILVPKIVAFQQAMRVLQGQAIATSASLNEEAAAAARAGTANAAAAARTAGGGIVGTGARGVAGTAAAFGGPVGLAAAGATLLITQGHAAKVANQAEAQAEIDALAANPQKLAAAKAQLQQLLAQRRQLTAAAASAPGARGAFGLDTNAFQQTASSNVDTINRQISQLNRQIVEASKSARDNGEASQSMANGLDTVASAAASTKIDVQAFNDVLEQLGHRFDVKAAQDALVSGFHDLGEQAKKSGTAVNGNSQAAIANRTALRNLYGDALTVVQAYADQTDAGGHAIHTQTQVAAKADETAKQFQKLAGKAGFAKGKVDPYVQALKQVPRTVQTDIIVDITNAERALGVLQGQINKLRSLDLPNAGSGRPRGYRGGTVGRTRIAQYSLGGSVFGGPPGRDTVPAFLDNGEEVIRADRARKFRPLLKAINNAPGLADGGTAGTPNLADIFSLILTSGGTKKKPLTPFATQFAQATVKTVRTDAAFLSNLTQLGDMGFGFLATQLLEQNDHTARVIAAQAVRWSRKKLTAEQTSLQRSAAQQKALGLLPAELAISSALRTSKNPTLGTIAAATGIDIGDLQAGLQAMSKRLAGNANAAQLLRGLNTVGTYQTTGWGDTTAQAGPTFQITVEDHSGKPVRAGEQAMAGAQRVFATTGRRW